MLLSLESPVFYILAQSASIQMCFVTSQNFLEEVLKRKSFENIFLAWKTSWLCSLWIKILKKMKPVIVPAWNTAWKVKVVDWSTGASGSGICPKQLSYMRKSVSHEPLICKSSQGFVINVSYQNQLLWSVGWQTQVHDCKLQLLKSQKWLPSPSSSSVLWN